MTKTYDEQNVRVLSGLKGIQMRPQMYIGETDAHGLFVLTREPADNFVDEWLAGRCAWGSIVLAPDNYVWVIDGGQGMPTGNITFESSTGRVTMNALQALVSEHHAGAKFDGAEGAYGDGSRGTHGIGIKATNAMSDDFQVWTRKPSGKWFHIGYADGQLVAPVSTGTALPPLPYGYRPPGRAGTVVRFRPNAVRFQDGAQRNPLLVHEWARMAAYLNGGLRIDVVTDEGATVYQEDRGIQGLLAQLVVSTGATELGPSFTCAAPGFKVALAFTDHDDLLLQGYTNGLSNPDGGHHVQAMLRAVAQHVQAAKMARQDFKADDVYPGLVGIVNVSIPSPTFSNQIKSKLIDDRAHQLFADQVAPALEQWVAGNKALIKRLAERANDMRKLRAELKAGLQARKELKGRKAQRLPAKLVEARCADADRVLFLMEGDSAGGTAKAARNRDTDEVLPLRGKVKNAYKVGKGQHIWDSEAVMDILKAVGYDPDAENPAGALRVGKIVLLGDADVDGWHVNLLNIALLAKVMPDVFAKGMVYVARGYEYIVETDDKIYVGDSVDDIRQKTPASLHKNILHLKGWGEVSARGLRYMVFDPATAQITRLTLDKGALHTIKLLMSEDTTHRKTLFGVQ